ncbi:MAG: DUF4179 domain-containing protein [Clostridium sp.]
MTNNKYNNIKIPDNIDFIVEAGAKKASNEKRKRKNKKAMAIAASVTTILTFGVISQPAIAKNIPLINIMYQKAGFSEKYLPITEYVGKCVEQNGIKLTIDNIAGSERAIKFSYKVEAENEIFKNPAELIHISGSVNGVSSGGGGGAKSIDEKSYIAVQQMWAPKGGFPSTGILKLDIGSDEYNINTSLEFEVDFKESSKYNFKKDVIMESKNKENKVVEIEATGLGTFLTVNKCKGFDSPRNGMLLKIDDKIYRSMSSTGDNKKMYLAFPELVYDDVKNAKNISVIEYNDENEKKEDNKPIKAVWVKGKLVTPEIDYEEVERANKIYEEEEARKKIVEDELPRKTKDNIEYISEVTSQDGNKVYISDVKREDGKIKIYVNGDERNDVLRVANSIGIWDENNKNTQRVDFIRENGNGYIVEVNNDINGKVKVYIGDILFYKNNLKFGEEVRLKLK